MPEPLVLTLSSPPSLNKLWISIPGKKRIRSPEYRAWLVSAGWEVKRQIVGMAPIACRYDAVVQVPVSRRDSDNWFKAIGDLLESVGVVTNDGNLHQLTITPTPGRTDCAVEITPLPGLGSVRKATRARPRGLGYQPPKRRSRGITSATLLGLK